MYDMQTGRDKKDMLQTSCFNDVWCFPESVNETMLIPLLRQRLRDIYITHWHTGLNTCTSMRLYKQIKTTSYLTAEVIFP